MIIFLDESGDLGFDFQKKKSSNFFVITLLVCHNKAATDSFKTAVNRTLKNKLNQRKKSRIVQELHATKIKFEIKKYFYNQIKNFDWSIYVVILNKKNVFENLTSKLGKKKLYNFLSNYILKKVDLSSVGSTVTLVVDKSKNKEEIEDFNGYLENQLEGLLPLTVPLNIYHEDSMSNFGLQAADLFSWGVYRKYEQDDQEWYDLFCKQIVVESVYLSKKK